jgi:hypothetical protein
MRIHGLTCAAAVDDSDIDGLTESSARLREYFSDFWKQRLVQRFSQGNLERRRSNTFEPEKTSTSRFVNAQAELLYSFITENLKDTSTKKS